MLRWVTKETVGTLNLETQIEDILMFKRVKYYSAWRQKDKLESLSDLSTGLQNKKHEHTNTNTSLYPHPILPKWDVTLQIQKEGIIC